MTSVDVGKVVGRRPDYTAGRVKREGHHSDTPSPLKNITLCLFDIKQLVLFTWIDTNYSTQHPKPNTQNPTYFLSTKNMEKAWLLSASE